MKKVISTKLAPAAIGTYSQAIQVGQQVYVSGQIPLDPVTMQMVEGPFSKQVEQVFSNLQAVAEAAGGGLHSIVKLTVYLQSMDYFSEVNAVMERCWQPPFPARAAVAVAELPREALVEMDAIMVLSADEVLD